LGLDLYSKALQSHLPVQTLHAYHTMERAMLRCVNCAFRLNLERQKEGKGFGCFGIQGKRSALSMGARDNDENMRLKYGPSFICFAHFLQEKGVTE
jgi:hypothetical protein